MTRAELLALLNFDQYRKNLRGYVSAYIENRHDDEPVLFVEFVDDATLTRDWFAWRLTPVDELDAG